MKMIVKGRPLFSIRQSQIEIPEEESLQEPEYIYINVCVCVCVSDLFTLPLSAPLSHLCIYNQRQKIIWWRVSLYIYIYIYIYICVCVCVCVALNNLLHSQSHSQSLSSWFPHTIFL